MQCRALRYVFNDYDSDYDTLLKRANMPSLELARQRQLCIEVFKAIHKLSPQYMSDLFPLQDTGYNTKTAKMVVQSHYDHVRYGVKSFKKYASHL